ncbi:class I SAM-dependent methyltransferase [Marinoscillum furvescens]|uniref:Tellurite resistance protein TehB n=1 Tax=Marinoscillum furvescens DSM 4134 TaxID=1122208 RepID=A0A3D9KY09_MARFU|nr:class I SAM-dependent methyltransferase [Marinoscillum furvescens]RED94144.1 tellurite resistance protein TehB [Marinoscillum furvescens DSM 4134]
MTVAYDKHYQTENLFGEPYPELISFFSNNPTRGKLLDLGCGQGRDAIALAKLGYEVTGIDNSAVGIQQMERSARTQGIKLTGLVADIYDFRDFTDFEFILLDSMFHFRTSELKRETELVERVINNAKKGTLIVFCIQHSGNKIKIFKNIVVNLEFSERTAELDFNYVFEDKDSNHKSTTKYKMVVIKK